jgi:hypothetical protein
VPQEVNLLTDPSAKVTVRVAGPPPAEPAQDQAGGESGG